MDRQTLNASLWDVEDSNPSDVHVRDMLVGPVANREVQEFARRYHYTATGGNITWRWGLWHGVTLLGVVAYNLPTRQTCESVFGSEHFDKVWHMGRLALAEEAPRNSESRLIAGSLTAIRKGHPNVWGVLTFADAGVGHVGYVYQATNALYTGTGGDSVTLVDEQGRRRGTKQGTRLTVAEIAERGWTSTRAVPKHRYLYVLGSKTERRQRMAQLRLPTLPYPKAIPDAHCEDCYRAPHACPSCPCHAAVTE